MSDVARPAAAARPLTHQPLAQVMHCHLAFGYPQHAPAFGWAAKALTKGSPFVPGNTSVSWSAAAKKRFLAHFRANPGQLACIFLIANSPALKKAVCTDAALRPLLRHGLCTFLDWVATPAAPPRGAPGTRRIKGW